MPYPVDAGDDDKTLSGDDRIVHRARKRFLRAQAWYGNAYKNSLDDTRFANADDRNRDQWDDKIYASRQKLRRPCLTINITSPHNRLVINESMQNKASIRVRPTGGETTPDAAEAMQMMIDRTEYISTAAVAYRTVITHQIDGGFGYLFLETDYINDKSFDQDVFIRAARDPRCVYLDPDAFDEPEKAQWGFVFDKKSRDRFNREHPKFESKVGKTTLGIDPIWLTDDHVLVAMYYEREAKNDELICYKLPDGEDFCGHRSQLEKDAGGEIVDRLIEQIDNGEIDGQYRNVITQCVNWYHIAGDLIIKRGDTDETRWIGRYVPIIPCYGIKTVIDGNMDCKGHTRCQISAQQMLNYNASAMIQFGALQSRTPYIGPARAFEFNEQEWATANIEDRAYLAYEDFVHDEGEEPREVKAPVRQEPPQIAPAFLQGMQDAERWAMMVTGQFQAQMGENDAQSAASGKAINARQRQGDIATYHFTEHQYDMYRYLGKQLIDIYPKLYDTKRILHVEGEDLSKPIITIDPDATEVFKRVAKETGTADQIIFNPLIGEYAVVSDPGPNYATERQRTWDAMTQLFTANKELAALCADMLFKYGDFDGSQEMAERVRKELKATKPYLFDDNMNPQVAALQAQTQRLVALNAELMQKLAGEELRRKGYEEKRDIEAFKADTSRMEAQIKALSDVVLTPQMRAQMEHELQKDARQHVYNVIEQANAQTVSDGDDGGGRQDDFDPTTIGARQAPDGHHYLPDPARPGKYLRVVH